MAPQAEALILACEVTDRRTYEQLYDRPVWPGGQSGVTIGIGYDLSAVTRDQFMADWAPYWGDVPGLARLSLTCGLRAEAARDAVPALASLRIPWNAAEAVFREVSLPVYAARTAAAFSGSTRLPLPCFGALVSLVYNRGAAMHDTSDNDRRREMREIRDAIASGRPEDVPMWIRAMKRLWPNGSGLHDRRDAEADMFKAGLAS